MTYCEHLFLLINIWFISKIMIIDLDNSNNSWITNLFIPLLWFMGLEDLDIIQVIGIV